MTERHQEAARCKTYLTLGNYIKEGKLDKVMVVNKANVEP